MAPLLTFALLAIPIVIAITFHEAAHGYVAHALGNDTTEREGRVSIDRHVDVEIRVVSIGLQNERRRTDQLAGR